MRKRASVVLYRDSKMKPEVSLKRPWGVKELSGAEKLCCMMISYKNGCFLEINVKEPVPQ